jgi:hypothetical protein
VDLKSTPLVLREKGEVNMAMENKLAPPIIESKIAAHTITENP